MNQQWTSVYHKEMEMIRHLSCFVVVSYQPIWSKSFGVSLNLISIEPTLTNIDKHESTMNCDVITSKQNTTQPCAYFIRPNTLLSALRALYERNPSIIDGFPSQRASYARLECFLCWRPEEIVEQTGYLLVIWYTMCDVILVCALPVLSFTVTLALMSTCASSTGWHV